MGGGRGKVNTRHELDIYKRPRRIGVDLKVSMCISQGAAQFGDRVKGQMSSLDSFLSEKCDFLVVTESDPITKVFSMVDLVG